MTSHSISWVGALVAHISYVASLVRGAAGQQLTLQLSDQLDNALSTYLGQGIEKVEILHQLQPNGISPFSSTVLKYQNKTYLAIRGTNDLLDIVLSDALGIALQGRAADQAVSLYRYWRQLTTPENAPVTYSSSEIRYLTSLSRGAFLPLLAPVAVSAALQLGLSNDVGLGILAPDARVEVVGHSLGGHLAQLFTRMFPQNVESMLTYNAAGVGGITGHLVDRLLSSLGGTSSPGEAGFTNYIADHGTSFTAGFGVLRGSVQRVFNELQGNPIGNHSIVNFTDSLAMYDLFSGLDPALSQRSIQTILDEAASIPAESLERAIDALRRALTASGDPVPSATPLDRNIYFTNLLALRESLEQRDLLGTIRINPLVGLSPAELVARAMGDDAQAYRYALAEGNAFALLGLDYQQHNANGQLNLAREDSNAGMLSREWLTDRAHYLPLLLSYNASDGAMRVPGTTAWFDRRANAALTPPGATATVIFGSDGDDSMEANAGRTLHAYGGLGNDILLGHRLADHLEGGTGNDVLEGGLGSDSLEGGAGFDTYTWNSGDEADQIFDSDGLGRIVLNGVVLNGGNREGRGIYWNADHSVQYAFSGPTSRRGILIINGELQVAGFRSGDFGIVISNDEPDENEIPGPYGFEYSDTPIPNGVDPVEDAAYPFGSPENDLFVGGIDWAPYFLGRGGDDTLEVAEETSDVVISFRGGAGNDTLIGHATGVNFAAHLVSRHLFAGESGNDVISGTDEDDALFGDFDRVSRFDAGNETRSRIGDTQLSESVFTSTIAQLHTYPSLSAQGIFIADDGLVHEFAELSDALRYVLGDISEENLGTSFNDVVDGHDGNDLIAGGSGNDTLRGGNGDDVIYGDNAPNGPVYFSRFSDFGDLAWMFGRPGDDYIDAGDGNDWVADIFGSSEVYGGDGSDEINIGAFRLESTADTANTIYIDAGRGDDLIRVSAMLGDAVLVLGGEGDDTIESELVFAQLEGGDGDDSYYLSSFVDAEVESDFYSLFPYAGQIRDSGGDDLLTFLGEVMPGVASSAGYFQVSRDGGDLIIGVDTAFVPVEFQDVAGVFNLRLLDWFAGPGFQIEQIVFEADGSSWSPADIEAMLADQEGDSTLPDADLPQSNDEPRFLLGTAADNVLLGGNEADTLYGADGDDALSGGAGGDTLAGGSGSDVYRYSLGDGDDLIADFHETGELNVIEFGAGISASSISLDAAGLVVHSAGTDAHLRLDGFDPRGDAFGIDRLDFEDGTSITFSTLLARGIDLLGTDSGDGLIGSRFADRLDGGEGDDVLIGAEGGDEYVFAAGWGKDLVVDYGGDTNTLRFGAGIAPDALTGAWRDNRLVLASASGVDEIAIEWAPDEGFRVDQALFADGTRWDSAYLDQLAALAQAAAAPPPEDPNDGELETPPDAGEDEEPELPLSADEDTEPAPTVTDPPLPPIPPVATDGGQSTPPPADAQPPQTDTGTSETATNTPPTVEVPAVAQPPVVQIPVIQLPVIQSPVVQTTNPETASSSSDSAGQTALLNMPASTASGGGNPATPGATTTAADSPVAPAQQAEIAQQVSQFFQRIQPPPLTPQAWLDSWTGPSARSDAGSREISSSSTPNVRESSPPAFNAPAAGDSPVEAPAPVESDSTEPQSLVPNEIAEHFAAMHRWLDTHPVDADGDDAYVDLRFHAGFTGGRGLYDGLSFGATAGIANLGVPQLQPFQGLREGWMQLGWS